MVVTMETRTLVARRVVMNIPKKAHDSINSIKIPTTNSQEEFRMDARG